MRSPTKVAKDKIQWLRVKPINCKFRNEKAVIETILLIKLLLICYKCSTKSFFIWIFFPCFYDSQNWVFNIWKNCFVICVIINIQIFDNVTEESIKSLSQVYDRLSCPFV